MTDEPCVGMTVYWLDWNRINRQGYLWRDAWVETKIIGETARSWLVGPDWMKDQLNRADKIAKKDWPGSYAVTEADMARHKFISDRGLIAQRVMECLDYAALKAVDDLLRRVKS